ncbi:MAG: APC family permease [Myxococcota bacterium]
MSADDRRPEYAGGSLTLAGAVWLGTGVMIGAGIFALTGQMAELTGALFPLAFLAAAAVVGASAYSYIRLSNAYPSAGGIAMFLEKAYGRTVTTAFHALLMYFSMVIAQSFLARTFGAYAAQLLDLGDDTLFIPVVGVALIVVIFVVNLAGNVWVSRVAWTLGVVKVVGILVFAVVGLAVADSLEDAVPSRAGDRSVDGFLGATALGILAFKGFTTITNSGSELVEPRRNVGRAIIISIAVCIVVYSLVGLAVAGNLSLPEIVATMDYSLAAAARPALGEAAVWFTVVLAMAATSGGLLASVFAVSRMLAMLTDMRLVPHSHFGMPGDIQKHTLVYTVVLGCILTAFFDLSRIAALGIIFYLIMDIAVHWGVLRHLRADVGAKAWVLLSAIALDGLVLGGFLWAKAETDPTVLGVAAGLMAALWGAEALFFRLRGAPPSDGDDGNDRRPHSHDDRT